MLLLGLLTQILGGGAAAQEPSYATWQECVQARPPSFDPTSWVCYTTPDGRWAAQIPEQGGASRANPIQAENPGPDLGGIFTFFLLWSFVPLVVAVGLANRHGESVAIAVVLTILLGWIGLAIVYFGQGRTRSTVEAVAQRAGVPSVPGGGPPPPPGSPAPTDPPEDRLRRLDRLLADGLLTDAEYRRQRQRVVDSL